jgi:hypothetical protein
MKAYGFSTPFSPRAQNYVEQLSLDLEEPRDHDLVVEIKGVQADFVPTCPPAPWKLPGCPALWSPCGH